MQMIHYKFNNQNHTICMKQSLHQDINSNYMQQDINFKQGLNIQFTGHQVIHQFSNKNVFPEQERQFLLLGPEQEAHEELQEEHVQLLLFQYQLVLHVYTHILEVCQQNKSWAMQLKQLLLPAPLQVSHDQSHGKVLEGHVLIHQFQYKYNEPLQLVQEFESPFYY
ncbi:hypothetical protein TTHERM_000115529 (macronuclear) [Tetrahymena thermophila SB210]|uniref:Uncharacterized protein n=1 Tax=Tetrahymena thermophila (strain SB210) TaxID=312017 RepID=W7XJQ1_TETTS|nr:hypothetical protein TTHERM_000115529 [Tetrahymena thermophila SB210]EWS75786.1 hypothetical protein TTHERM_000115529 [Tetrahymena thermophila SB210]|eukprot:XP_012651708.1 hypothetical protein TTHERM_000115529 [Tetrahymena thermophila SB210]